MNEVTRSSVVLIERSALLRESLEYSLETAQLHVLACSERSEFETAVATDPGCVVILDAAEFDSPSEAHEYAKDCVNRGKASSLLVLTRGADSTERRYYEELGAGAVVARESTTTYALSQLISRMANSHAPLTNGEAPTARAAATDRVKELSPRELEVLSYVAGGADNLKIAHCLGITVRTVRAHMSNLYRKLELENRIQLALTARTSGIRPPAGFF